MAERASRLAVLSEALGVFAIVAAIAGVGLAFSGVLAPLSGFKLFQLALPASLLALALGIAGLFATRSGAHTGRGRAWIGIVTGAAVLGIILRGALVGAGLPVINDITTSPEDPPSFEAAALEEPNRGRDMSYPLDFAAQQREAYPDLAPIILEVSAAEAFDRGQRAAEALGWEVVRSDRERGHLEAREVTRLFHFVDDIVIRVRETPSGSMVDVRSKSRDGRGDLGVNARRINAFEQAIR